MKNILYRALLLSSLLLVAWQTEATPSRKLKLEQVEALEKILPGVPYQSIYDTVRIARGETATFQFVLTADEPIQNPKVSLRWENRKKPLKSTTQIFWVGLVGSSYFFEERAPDRLLAAGNRYPDPLLTAAPENIGVGERGNLWCEVKTSAEVAPGLYDGVVEVKAKIDGKKQKIQRPVVLQIYDVELPQTTQQKVVNWHYIPEAKYTGGQKLIPGTEVYWKWFSQLADMLTAYGQNCWKISERPHVTALKEGGWTIDFTNFDRAVTILREKGNLALICGSHFAHHGNKEVPYLIEIPLYENGECTLRECTPSDSVTKVYIDFYFKALTEHLKTQKWNEHESWFDHYAQHISDEPRDQQLPVWEEIARMIKAASPSMRIMEAYLATGFNPELLDIAVPQLDALNRFSKVVTPRTELWMYVCCYPRYDFANRFIELPLFKTRLLHWIAYKYNCKGFLHWGLNYWEETPDPYQETANVTNKWSGGDSFIIYPGDTMSSVPSIRLAAMRDGINDYKLLEAIARVDADKAQEFAARLVQDAAGYDLNLKHFRTLRKDMLEYLTQAGR